MSLRLRLTLQYVGIIAGMLLFFSMAIFLLLTFLLMRDIDRNLETAANNIIAASSYEISGVPLSIIQLELDLTSNVLVQVLDADGNIIRQSSNLMGYERPLDPLHLNASSPTTSIVYTGNSRLRVLTIPSYEEQWNEKIGHIQLASSLQVVDQMQSILQLVMVTDGFVAILAAMLLVWKTTDSALKPLLRATETAERITKADDLSRRIPTYDLNEDEVGRLIVAFNATLERMEGFFDSQQRFLADVSHELRTPLTSIKGNVKLMQELGQLDEGIMRAINSEVGRMTRLVQDILLIEQAERGELPMERSVVEIDTLMLEVYHQGKGLARSRVKFTIGAEDQALVYGDRDRLKQVLLNLVVNAIDYTAEDGDVSLGLTCVDDWVVIEVKDNGEGIAADDLPNLFDRFYRKDRSRKRNTYGGTGLGLSIAYWIVKSHGGRIEVESQINVGSTFYVWLPRYLKEQAASQM